MKKVFSTSQEVAHIWASGSQEEGRNSTKNIFFEGDTIYSYGYHFPIAVFDRAKNIAFLNAKRYSVTTAGHISDVRQALRNRAQFIFEIPLPSHVIKDVNLINTKDGAEYLKQEAIEAAKTARKARANVYKINLATSTASEFLKYAKFFKIKGVKLAKGDTLTMQEVLDLRAKNEAGEKTMQEKREMAWANRHFIAQAELEAQQAKDSQTRLDWLAGIGDTYPRTYTFGVAARLRVKGDEVQTSQGARVPLKAGIFAFKAWDAHNKGLGASLEGLKLGAYTVESHTANSIKIGCHVIDFDEAKRVLENL